MKSFIYLIILTIIIGFANTVNAQASKKAYKGYVLLESGKKITGNIEMLSPLMNQLKVKVKSLDNLNNKTFKSQEVKEYAFQIEVWNHKTSQYKKEWIRYTNKEVGRSAVPFGSKKTLLLHELKGRINYYNYSRFSELLINKLVVNNQISDFEIDQTFFSKCLQYSSYKTNEMTLLEKPISFKRIDNEEKQDIIILELKNKIINLIKTSDFEKYYNDNLVFFEDKQYSKYKKLKKQGKLDLDNNSFNSDQIKNYEKIIEFDMLYSEYLKNIKKIETIKKRQSNDELFDKYGFKVYQDWIKQNPKIESRSHITDIMSEFTNLLSVTNFKNYYTTNFINWQIEYGSLHFRDYFEDKKLLLQFSKIIQKSINYGNNINWENIGLINYEDLGEKRLKYIKEKNKWIREYVITEKPKDYDYIDLPNYFNTITELFKMKLCNEIIKFIKDERNKLFENNERVYLNQNYLSSNNFKPEKFIKYIYNISDTFEKK